MSLNNTLRVVTAEATRSEPPELFGPFMQRNLVKMAVRPEMQPWLERRMRFLEPNWFNDDTANVAFACIHSYWKNSKDNTLRSRRSAENVIWEAAQGDADDPLTVDSPEFAGIKALLAEELTVADVAETKAYLDKAIRHRLCTDLVTSEGYILAAQLGDIDRIQQYNSEVAAVIQSLDEHDDEVNVFSDPDVARRRDNVPRLRLGFPQLDLVLGKGGPARGEVLCYLGRTGVGKSIILSNDAVASALAGQNTLFITLEMPIEDMADRCLSIFTKIPTDKLPERWDEARAKCHAKYAELGRNDRLKIRALMQSVSSINDIKAHLTRLKQGQQWVPDVIVIDYLELLKPFSQSSQGEEIYVRQRDVSADLCYLADEQDCLVVTATQTNRDGYKNQSTVDLGQMADSYGKSMGIDYIVGINQSDAEYRLPTPLMRLNIIKNRKGPRGEFNMLVDYDTLQVVHTRIGINT
jgi:replicative DNA helicase